MLRLTENHEISAMCTLSFFPLILAGCCNHNKLVARRYAMNHVFFGLDVWFGVLVMSGKEDKKDCTILSTDNFLNMTLVSLL